MKTRLKNNQLYIVFKTENFSLLFSPAANRIQKVHIFASTNYKQVITQTTKTKQNMRTFIIISNETGIYEQQVDHDKYVKLVKDTKVRATIKPNKELTHERGLIVLDCHAFVGEEKEEVTCRLTRELNLNLEDGEELDLDYELECEMECIQSGDININTKDQHDKISWKYKRQIIEHSTLFKQVCIGEPRLLKPTVKYFD